MLHHAGRRIPVKKLILIAAFGLAGCSASGNGGATGAAPERYMGERANVSGTHDGKTSSSSMLEQRIKQDSARGVPSGSAGTRYRGQGAPCRVAISGNAARTREKAPI
jgi:hypothetical protein